MHDTRLALWASASLCALLASSACSKEQAAQPVAEQPPLTARAGAPAITSAAPAAVRTERAGGREANKIFKTRCVVCHGESGRGDGPGAAALQVKPREYGDPAWQGSVTDAEIEAIIVKGGAAVGKDAGMPANPDLASKPEVVQGLRMIVRSFAPERE